MLRIISDKGEFGFQCEFARNLTIIRGGNSSGKSTLYNCLLYCLGMEELIGARGEKALPYAVKDYFDYADEHISVIASEVFLEIENRRGEVRTVRRAIRDQERDTKLVDVFTSSHLVNSQPLGAPLSTYLHDAGAAQKLEGFHKFLEDFLALKLPQVPTTSGGETKLYLQTVFAALAVEQKRGWTDYIAGIPFFGIREARIRVVEFLLGLGVFESNALRNRLNSQKLALEEAWSRVGGELRKAAADSGATIEGLVPSISSDFARGAVRFSKLDGADALTIDAYLQARREEHSIVGTEAESYSRISGEEALRDADRALQELQSLGAVYEQATNTLAIHKASLSEYKDLFREAREDLDRNKTAQKLQSLGGQHSLALAQNRCPTCDQAVENSLLLNSVGGVPMDLATNVAYLDSQCRMLERQLAGISETVRHSEVATKELSMKLAQKHDALTELRGDISSGSSQSRALIRRQLEIELEFSRLQSFSADAERLLAQLEGFSTRFAENKSARQALPGTTYSENDERRIALFEKFFRLNAGSFDYGSAVISEIEIQRGALVPHLAQIELKTIADIRTDSSASDFVRLIWSYLLALYQTSSHPTVQGNHPGILLLDEPGQHSMAELSQHALLQQLANETNLQSIVAASFDENESVFLSATKGVKFKLIEWHGKLIRPVVSRNSANGSPTKIQ